MMIEEVLGLMAIMFVSFFWGAYFTYALYEKEIKQIRKRGAP
jgi:hypothetical protein